jgi:hypothetical protein
VTQEQTEFRQLLLQIAERANARLIEARRIGSGHQRFTFAKGGTNISIIASSSPSDYRDRQNTAAIAGRVLRQA